MMCLCFWAIEWARVQEVVSRTDSDVKQLGFRELVLKHLPTSLRKLGMSYAWKVDDTSSDVCSRAERLVAGLCSRGARGTPSSVAFPCSVSHQERDPLTVANVVFGKECVEELARPTLAKSKFGQVW